VTLQRPEYWDGKNPVPVRYECLLWSAVPSEAMLVVCTAPVPTTSMNDVTDFPSTGITGDSPAFPIINARSEPRSKINSSERFSPAVFLKSHTYRFGVTWADTLEQTNKSEKNRANQTPKGLVKVGMAENGLRWVILKKLPHITGALQTWYPARG